MNLFNDLEKYSSNTAIVTESSDQISYLDLLDAADSIGNHIKKRCLVFFVCNNCFESVAGYIGFLRAGSALALIQDTTDNTFIANLIEVYKPEYIYLPAKKSELQINCTIVHTFGDYTLLKTDHNVVYTLHENLALLLTTSGSTGSPKFVRQSYKNINSNAEAIAQYLGITSNDRPISTMPMSYTFMLSIINSHLLKGASIILTNVTLMERHFWRAIKENNATTFGGVPYIFEMLKKLRFEKVNLPSLKYITQAGGKLSMELSAEFADICVGKGIEFYVMYGQTEATARISYLPCEYAQTKVGSVGIPIPGGKMWLEDSEGNQIDSAGVAGELVYQGDNVTLGYAEDYLDLAKGDENNGLLRTGDIAECDDDGFFTIVGRAKRFLKMYGIRINLDEIEQLVTEQGYDCACSGEDNELVIYLTKSKEIENIKSYISKKMKIHPSGVDVKYIKKVPRNESGKILYSELA